MTPLLSTLLLGATASAQLTTTFWQPDLGTDKIGFVGSIIAANDTHTTAVLDFDAAVDQSALHLGGYPATFTIGPNVYEESYDNFAGQSMSASDAGVYRLHCENGTGNRTCTASFGAAVGYQQWCPRTANQISTVETLVMTHSYSARLSYSAGVETFTDLLTFLPNTRTPESWCSESDVEMSYVTTVEMPQESFKTYQLVITAGIENLSATQGGSVSFPSATPTGSQTISGSSSRSSAPSQQTANAAPLVTDIPAVIGLGAAVAAILL